MTSILTHEDDSIAEPNHGFFLKKFILLLFLNEVLSCLCRAYSSFNFRASTDCAGCFKGICDAAHFTA